MKRASVLVGLALFLTLGGIAWGQTEAPPKPSPELQKLNYFVGNWTSEGDMKPGPMGPGGKITIKEDAKWMDGGFFVVFHSSFTGTMGNGTAIAFMGYDPQEKVYTYDEFNSMGEAVHSKGHLEGDTWTWTNEMKMGPQTIQARFLQKIVSPSTYTYKFEMSPDGSNWNLVMDGKDVKSK
jgi:Protein of unknown function (DUF1579)